MYIFAGRFQPFHNGHLEVLRQLCEIVGPEDTLILAVVAPFHSQDIKDKAFLDASKEHHKPERNPWDVSVVLEAVSHVALDEGNGKRILTTLLPRPEYGWETIVKWFPSERIWVIPLAHEDFDEKKVAFFIKMGDKVIRFSDETKISGQELRKHYENQRYDEFASQVPKGVANIYFAQNTSENDFEKRAKHFENYSKWVKDQNINSVPANFLCQHNIGQVLDAGGGTGYLSWYLYQQFKGKIGSISLVDTSRNMLDEAEKKHNNLINTHNVSIETFCKVTTNKYDTVLLRQVLHYVDDVDEILKSLKSTMKNDGLMYIGQFVTHDEECKKWHDELMKSISKNRRRSFTQDELINYVKRNGFEIVQMEISGYDEKISDLYQRRTNPEVATSLEDLKNRMKNLKTKTIVEKMDFRCENNDLYFKMGFCHLLCKIKK